MLMPCPECALNVSDKAIYCPHCGFPLKPEKLPKKMKGKNNKRRRLPNGFGQISEIKNRKLRNPFRAMITVGKTETGRSICKPLKPQSYFPTYNAAYEALVEYNNNPYDLDVAITVSELYEKWTSEYFKTLKSASSIRTITSAWSYCSSIYNMRAKDIRARHIKGCMDDGVAIIKGEKRLPSANMQSRIKSLFNLMLDYALEYEIVDRNYARTFNTSSDVLKECEENSDSHITFSDEEISILWDNLYKVPYVDILLIQCYSGWRPQELGLIELKNIDFKNNTFIGGMKTEAGTERIVPIHSKIKELVKFRYDEAVRLHSKYLFNCPESKNSVNLTYDKYRSRFKKIIECLNLNPEHKPHDGRVYFVTTAKKYNVDQFAIKYIVGHKINDLTEKVYTKREASWLKTEIEKIN